MGGTVEQEERSRYYEWADGSWCSEKRELAEMLTFKSDDYMTLFLTYEEANKRYGPL